MTRTGILSICDGPIHRMAVALLAMALCAPALSGAAGQELRTWSDATGRFKVTAKFVEVSGGNVRLEREDGTALSVPLARLSEADRKVVAELQVADENPFKPVAPSKGPAKTRRDRLPAGDEDQPAQADAVAGEATLVKPRWSDARQLLAASSDSKWNLSIDAPASPTPAKPQAIPLPAKRDFFERATALVANPHSSLVVAAYSMEAIGREGRRDNSRIVVGDLDKGKIVHAGLSYGKLIPLALNDSGSKMLIRREASGHGSPDTLETWEIGPSGLSRLLEWNPHDIDDRGEQKIKWARYVDAEKVLTMSAGGKLTLWNSVTAQPLWWLKVDGGCFPAISPGGKYVAFAGENEIDVLDVVAGEVVAMQPKPKANFLWPIFAFTPRGTRLVCGSFDRAYVWDVATGALYRDIPMAGDNVHIDETMICPSEEHLLVGKNTLFDIESQVKVWTYKGHEMVASFGGVCLFEVVDANAGAIIPAVLPQPSALERIQTALDAPDFFVLKPGVTVKLNLSGIPDPGERDKAGASLTEKLVANGFQVGPNGTIELAVTAEAGRRREVAYHGMGPGYSRVYTVQEFRTGIKFVYKGQTAWEVSVTSVPGFTRLQRDETMEEHLKKSEHPSYQWIGTVELPKFLQRPTAGSNTIGITQITTIGLRDATPSAKRAPRR